MHLARPMFAAHPSQFGHGPVRTFGPTDDAVQFSLSDEVKLFGTTFLAGFLFVSLLIG